MNYYSHHIGDFDRATRHLTRLERSIYLDLIFVYYDTEQPLTLDKKALCRKIIARTNEEATAVEQVLSEFFTETPTGWFHARCEQELDIFRNSTSQKSLAGKASAAKRAAAKQQALNGNPTPVEQTLDERSTDGQLTNNQQPISTNQEPETKNQQPKEKKNTAPPDGDLFPGVAQQVVADFKQLRKQKRAPITKTAMDKIASEAVKAGLSLEGALQLCCSRGWQGFEAEWVNKPGAAGSANSDKFRVANLDHSSSDAAMAASMKRHNIVTPADGDIPF